MIDQELEDFGFSRAYKKIYYFDQRVGLGSKLSGKVVLDVGSSTGGFTKFALEKGAKKVIAVEIGTDQMDYSLVQDKRVKLYEKIDIFNVITKNDLAKLNKKVIQSVDVAVVDVSFLSCREVLVHLKKQILDLNSCIILLFKPQFEAKESELNKGIIKNSKIRRKIIKDFESWLKLNKFLTEEKMDSELSGLNGKVERFYLLRLGK